jgi:hypothetical protein
MSQFATPAHAHPKQATFHTNCSLQKLTRPEDKNKATGMY